MITVGEGKYAPASWADPPNPGAYVRPQAPQVVVNA